MHQVSLQDITHLLPTPRVSDGNGAGIHGDGGPDLRTAVTLLPTPAVNDMGAGLTVERWDEWTAEMKAKHANGNGHGPSLSVEARRVDGARWGKYGPAIVRHEAALGRPAPAPTEPTGKDGAAQLSPRFVEWMMGLEGGWVTGIKQARAQALAGRRVPRDRRAAAADSLTRAAQLKLLGNGVVPAQAAAAIADCLAALGVVTEP